ncbi:MAG: hypothetical protein WCW13_03925 [archaeon]|jgi:uncharacterized protein (UPF0333 family)
MEEKAQVNLEYLLVITGAVVIVTIVTIFIKSSVNTTTDAAIDQTRNTP